MTTTTRRMDPTTSSLPPKPELAATAAVPAPPKARRRWGMLAAMAAVVCLGVVGNVLLLGAVSDTEQVVAASATIERGAVISREALMGVQVSTDPALATIPAAQIETLVGQRAAVDIVAGSLLTPASTTIENIPTDGTSLVGIAVSPAMMPGTHLVAGDRIRIVATPGLQGEFATDVPVESAVVVSAAAGTELSGQGAQTIVTVEVPEASAPQLAAMAATGRVAIVLDSRDR